MLRFRVAIVSEAPLEGDSYEIVPPTIPATTIQIFSSNVLSI